MKSAVIFASVFLLGMRPQDIQITTIKMFLPIEKKMTSLSDVIRLKEVSLSC